MTRDAGSAVRAAVRQGLSVAVATGLYGISFGALSVAAGVGVWPTMALSLLLFSGGSQFALVGVVGSGGSPFAAVATAALLGVRNGLYGAVVAPVVRARGPRRLLAAQLTIDESTAVAAAQGDRRAARAGFWVAGGGVFVLWNVFTLVGALAGDALGDPRAWGLDAAAAAAFLGLVWPRLAPRRAQLVAAVAVAVSVTLVPFVPPGVPVIAAAGAAILVGLAAGPDGAAHPRADDADPAREGALR
ncbi:AzlC family protein [Xylanimonas cellulosilytica DSM 15894]|uniref:AzlC family protein n=1 Tax=Xylanimonas cellulosilytica (strain DSM 15894 / JCM 12276 / CECT 5975 / KCTC 9989 / LMG 20990 / NBRC 107835 / XIL07) TaxID=446471 RepID=D1C069_XYLCX|nr:AzlC family ABC transporter permease [Xylanimonas cellulosilytica]ACZ30258.1 AzlC family protein [Xylanimonas cellulosilytica DSM 15894]